MVCKLECGHEKISYEIQYIIGTTYDVCSDCLALPHFARGIRSKKEIEKAITQTQSKKKTIRLVEESGRTST